MYLVFSHKKATPQNNNKNKCTITILLVLHVVVLE